MATWALLCTKKAYFYECIQGCYLFQARTYDLPKGRAVACRDPRVTPPKNKTKKNKELRYQWVTWGPGTGTRVSQVPVGAVGTWNRHRSQSGTSGSHGDLEQAPESVQNGHQSPSKKI